MFLVRNIRLREKVVVRINVILWKSSKDYSYMYHTGGQGRVLEIILVDKLKLEAITYLHITN